MERSDSELRYGAMRTFIRKVQETHDKPQLLRTALCAEPSTWHPLTIMFAIKEPNNVCKL
jgi:hypothetical protein